MCSFKVNMEFFLFFILRIAKDEAMKEGPQFFLSFSYAFVFLLLFFLGEGGWEKRV
jgi:hypothetical protein